METILFDAHIELNVSKLPESGEEVLKLMAMYGAKRAIVIPTTEDVSDKSFTLANEALLTFCQKYPNILFPFCRLQPKMGESAAEALKTYLEHNFYGLFLAPEQEQFYIDHCIELFRILDARKKPLLLVTQKHLMRNPRYWQGAIEKFPHVPFIFAHAGQDDYQQAIDMAIELPNVYLETSALNRLRSKACVQAVPEGKIVFGSGYPISDGRLEKMKYEILQALQPTIAFRNIQTILNLPDDVR